MYMQSPTGEVFQTSNPEYHTECTKLTDVAGRIARRDYARAELRKMLKPGDEVATILRHVSSSGMTRRISLVIVHKGEIRGIDYLAADAMGAKCVGNGEGVTRTGCGMDMGFDLVYSLGAALWPNGTRKPHGMRNGEPDSDGGYALMHRWL